MNIELLAPAGSYDSMVAAMNAGADAVYIGGTRFGARAYADNPDEDLLKQAIDLAHKRGKKIYLTVNTLLKESEIDTLYDYLKPYYREGLDAVIVQDMGVFAYIRDQFPGMDIHASTQMTVTGPESAAYLKSLGASRIVTAREMSLQEIRLIHDKVDIEIETFVHGALCFCYSGQCLLSSIIGGRSGNRGRCAQPCRLPYELYEDGKLISDSSRRFLLSPKDMCTVELIPDLIESGIYSFKMEGRMKKPEYTAGITSIYRKYIDLYEEKGKGAFSVSKEDQRILMDLYNRGGFNDGYFHKHNGKEMMSMERPNHRGTAAAKVISVSGNIKCKALEELNIKDVLEIPGKRTLLDTTISQKATEGQSFSLPLIKGASVKKDSILYRTRNQLLIDELTQKFIKRNSKVKIKGKLKLFVGESAIITIVHPDAVITVTGEVVQPAVKRPVTKEEIGKQIRKTGQTFVEFEELEIDMFEDIFISMQGLNELRRMAISKLEEKLISQSMREVPEKICLSKEKAMLFRKEPYLYVSVETREQLKEVLAFSLVKRIYLSYTFFPDIRTTNEQAGYYIRLAHEKGIEIYYITSWIHRQERGKDVLPSLSILSLFDGVLCKSLETFTYLKQMGYDKPIVADHNLYIFNRQAKNFWHRQGISSDTISLELHSKEIRDVSSDNSEMVIYGYIPLMISAQCFRRNCKRCEKTQTLMYLKDRKGMLFPVKNHCGYCSNIIYNSAPLELISELHELKENGISTFRISFTIEDSSETKKVMNLYSKAIVTGDDCKPVHESFTRGHYKRGVE